MTGSYVLEEQVVKFVVSNTYLLYYSLQVALVPVDSCYILGKGKYTSSHISSITETVVVCQEGPARNTCNM